MNRGGAPLQVAQILRENKPCAVSGRLLRRLV